ncbi:hypothetical protein DO021_14180 [Desulfobacter hydrogenophilus]|uniref:Uncharacterized protein n=1 Tax=Desulfobacter hydrogenophilus TaxID=2291 RepID=A0A328FAW3_9BACT|nr:hypothetical protein DO021_14180 [Desulfobacter hydrogenophilus]
MWYIFSTTCFYNIFFVEQTKCVLITIGSTNPYFQKVFFEKLNIRKECKKNFLRFLPIFCEFLQIKQKSKKPINPQIYKGFTNSFLNCIYTLFSQ